MNIDRNRIQTTKMEHKASLPVAHIIDLGYVYSFQLRMAWFRSSIIDSLWNFTWAFNYSDGGKCLIIFLKKKSLGQFPTVILKTFLTLLEWALRLRNQQRKRKPTASGKPRSEEEKSKGVCSWEADILLNFLPKPILVQFRCGNKMKLMTRDVRRILWYTEAL